MSKVVLVIDDNRDNIGVIQHGLEYLYPSRYNIVWVEDKKKCFELLNTFCKPDVIILNIMLSGLIGWEIYGQLKRNDKWRDIPIIFLSDRNDKVARVAGETHRELYIETPIVISHLAETINRSTGKDLRAAL